LWDKVRYMGLKLDMNKAYDRVKLNFLEAIMRQLGFSTQWIRLIMVCIQTVSYVIVVNGQPVERTKPTGGIQQWIHYPCTFSSFVQRRLALFSTMLRGQKLSQEYQPLEKAHVPIIYFFLMIAYYFARQILWNGTS
jgi:hypothetical protein